MGLILPGAAQGGALFDAEAVLLIGDGEGQVGQFDAVLDDGVGADEEVEVSLGRHAEDLATGRGAGAAGEEAEGEGSGEAREVG